MSSPTFPGTYGAEAARIAATYPAVFAALHAQMVALAAPHVSNPTLWAGRALSLKAHKLRALLDDIAAEAEGGAIDERRRHEARISSESYRIGGQS